MIEIEFVKDPVALGVVILCTSCRSTLVAADVVGASYLRDRERNMYRETLDEETADVYTALNSCLYVAWQEGNPKRY